MSLKGAKGLIINITGGKDITLYEVDEAANRIKQEIDDHANIIYGTTCDERLEGLVRVSIVATGIDANEIVSSKPLNSFVPIKLNNEVYKDNSNFENSLEEQESNENQQSRSEEIIIENNDYKTEAKSNSEMPFSELNEENDVDEDNFDGLEEEINITSEFKNVKQEDDEIENLEDKNNNEEIPENVLESEKIDKESDDHPTVRRLSLFDTDIKEQQSENLNNSEKSEPILSKNEHDEVDKDDKNENILAESDKDTEFDPLEGNSEEIDDEFNQETEEELLDIPTFLRRQAN